MTSPGYDPLSATRQQFADAIIRLFSVNHADGYGWHLTGMVVDDYETVLTYRTPQPLQGWAPDRATEWPGPREVKVIIIPSRPDEDQSDDARTGGCREPECGWHGPLTDRRHGYCPAHWRPGGGGG